MSAKQKELAKDLLRRANLSPHTIDMCKSYNAMCLALEVVADLKGDLAPDENWFRDWYTITGEHMVLTEDGWIPAEFNTTEHTGAEPMEVLAEVNAPGSAQ